MTLFSPSSHLKRFPVTSLRFTEFHHYQEAFLDQFWPMIILCALRWPKIHSFIPSGNRLLARVCAVNNCLIKTVPSCSLCGVLSLISV